MWTHLPICFLVMVVAILQPTRGKYVTTSIFPSCTETNFPNFSYAKALQSLQSPAATSCNDLNIDRPTAPLPITWYYYDTYPPAPCGNPSFPDGDQCCHTTATSTLTFYNTVFVNTLLGAVGTSTGNVTAGAFLGQSATLVLTRANANLNCITAYGQEARTATVSVTIGNGPSCLNGVQIQELCPGIKN